MDNFTGRSPHEPLSSSDPSEIRLIKLFPGAYDDSVRCELHHVSLSYEYGTSFIALSYTWGLPNVTIPIRLNGDSFPVTTNLHSFLRHMQAVILAIAAWLPRPLRQPDETSTKIRHTIVSFVLHDEDFPRQFPFDALAIESLVLRHCLGFAQACRLEDLGHLAEFVDDYGVDDDDYDDNDLAECYLNFWVDAVCINQQDLVERTKQVCRMKEIYSRAGSVLVWLGDTVASNVDAMDAAFRLVPDVYDAVSLGQDAIELFTSEGFISSRLDDILKVYDILSVSWFSRIWIIQEVTNASEDPITLLGFQPISWALLAGGLTSLCTAIASFSDIRALERMFDRNTNNLRMLQILARQYRDLPLPRDSGSLPHNQAVASRLNALLRHTMGRFEATDPRDLFYALHGLLGTNDIPNDISPDYTKTTPQIFHKYAAFFARHGYILDFLHFAKRELPQNVPTWVPDWRFLSGNVITEPGSNEVTHRPSTSVVLSEDGMQLDVSGTVLGRVTAVVKSQWSADLISLLASGRTEDEQRIMLPFHIFDAMKHYKRECSSSWIASVSEPDNPDPEGTFQRNWERLWDKSGKYKFFFDHLEQDDQLELIGTVSEGFDAAFITFKHRIAHEAKVGLAILDGGQLVGGHREDISLLAGDVVCQLGDMKGPCILRKRELNYQFVSMVSRDSYPVTVIQEVRSSRMVERFIIV